MMPRGAAHIWRALLLLLLLPGVRTTDGEPRALRTHSASLSSTSHSPVQHIDIARAFPRNRTLALFIAGTRVRFLSRTLLQQVILPCVRDGFEVHVYLSLVGHQNRTVAYEGFGIVPDPETARLSAHDFLEYLRLGIRGVGGHLTYYEHLHGPEPLDALPADDAFRGRMQQYSPYSDSRGRAVLRVWKARERMWRVAQGIERQRGVLYQFVLWTRDDAFWIGQVRLRRFPQAVGGNVLFSRDCRRWGGINDKTVLLGRAAAPALMTAYRSFWDPGMDGTVNAEQYLKHLAVRRNVQLQPVPFALLPSLDAMVSNETQAPCIKWFYSCVWRLPAGSPGWCRHWGTEGNGEEPRMMALVGEEGMPRIGAEWWKGRGASGR